MVTGFQGFTVPDAKYHVISTPLSTNSGVVDITIVEDRYAALATGSGIEVVDLFCGKPTSSGLLPGITSVSVDVSFGGNMYIGTLGNGVYAVPWAIAKHVPEFSSQIQQIYTTATTPSISSNEVNYLAALPFRLLISTGEGIDYITDQVHTQLGATRPLLSGSSFCALTSDQEGYWISTNSGVEVNYDLNSSSGTGIITVDFEYNNTDSVPKLPTNTINDVSVTEGNPNLLSFATTVSGVFVVEESQGSEASSQTKILSTGDVVSVDTSNTASFTSEGLYVAAADSVTVFNLGDDSVSGTHFYEISAADKFNKENTRDQALVTGTVTVLRTTGAA